MKIILNEDFESVGKRGEIVKVKSGYARNFLIPKGIAISATERNIAIAKKQIEINELKEAKERKNIEALVSKLNKLTLKFSLKAGEDGKLFGSVTSQMIADAIEEKGYKIDKKEVGLEDSIKNVGNSKVSIKFGKDLEAQVKVKVEEEKA